MGHYQYMKHCAVEGCELGGRQLGQSKSCPIHHQSTSRFVIMIELNDWTEKPRFVDPAMA